MELKVGMYVRTKITDNCNCVYIRKITEIDDSGTLRNQICIDEDVIDGWGDDRIWIDIEDIAKASHNLLGNDQEPCLIEAGDYVNGYPVYEIIEYEDNTRAIVIGDDNKSIIWEESSQYIKSIVTKEMYSSVEYRVEVD